MPSIELSSPCDFHLHLRDGECLQHTVPAAAKQFSRALIMPNLQPPVVTTALAQEYRQRILAQVPAGASTFHPLMTLYLTDTTTPAEIKVAKESGVVFACKLYPAGATTNSDNGVTDIPKLYPTLRAMAEHGILLLVHGEVTDQTVDIFDRERVFIERHLRALVADIPELRVVMEHITTADAVRFVSEECGPNVGATITAHHLLENRNALFVGGIRPHYFCLPILKSETHRRALVAAAVSGNPKFFAGTDSAPHAVGRKHSACGCAGCFTSFAALELYAEAFEQAGHARHGRLDDFVSRFGNAFYGLEPRANDVAGRTLVEETWTIPERLPFGADEVVPFRSATQLKFRMRV